MEDKFEKNGTYKRVTIESYLVDPASLVGLQEQLKKVLPDIRMQSPEKLHMTLGHFGKPNDLFNQIVWANPKITLRELLDKFSDTLIELQSLITKPYSVRPKSIEFFGHGAVVLEVEVDEEVTNAKEEVYDKTVNLFESLGVRREDAENLIAQSYDLKFLDPSTGHFHITLGYVDERPSADIKLRAEELTLPQKIMLKPSTIRNFKV